MSNSSLRSNNKKTVAVKPVKAVKETKATKEVEEVKKPTVEEPEVTVEEETEETSPTEEVPEVKVNASKPSKQPNVRINPNADLRTYIGDQWYNLKKGVQISVPQQVKEILAKGGYLNPL